MVALMAMFNDFGTGDILGKYCHILTNKIKFIVKETPWKAELCANSERITHTCVYEKIKTPLMFYFFVLEILFCWGDLCLFSCHKLEGGCYTCFIRREMDPHTS